MKTLVLQNLTHRGTVSAAGFLFSVRLLPENEIRRRILSMWEPGTKVFRYRENLILLPPQPRRVDCRFVLGLPLVKYGRVWSSFPLQKKDLEQLADLPETMIFLEQGEIKTLPVGTLETENIEGWFDISPFQVVETRTLGEVKLKPTVIEKVTDVDVREALKRVPKADAQMMEVLKALKEKSTHRRDGRTDGGVRSSDFQPSSSSSASNAFSGMFDVLRRFFSGKTAQQSGGGRYSGQEKGRRQYSTPGGGGQYSEPKPPSKFANKIRQFFTKALFQMKVAQILGKQQARYLAKMMEMFESGDIKEALKYAIPLDDMKELQELTKKTPYLGFLRPRDDLKINYGRTATNSSVFLEDDWFNDLQKLYRQTFDRLVAQNRIEEAAFVLAELLKNNSEAVEFLEKHGKLRLAAELAEARGLSKEIIVRQWFIAGEKRRAIQLAVLHNCFEYVVTKLEQQKHPQAAELRQLWAENLADSGNYTAAVNVIWPLEAKRDTAKEWIDKVIEFGGAVSGQMLAKKITNFPESFDEIKARFEEFLAENSSEGQEKRLAFALEALRLNTNDELRILSRPLARKILADMAKDSRRFAVLDFRQLIELTGDYALRTDLPKLPQITEGAKFEPLTITVEEREKGAGRVYDTCLLPDGKMAVALGEAGVKIISKTGKTIAHFDQPTQRFIVSDFGTKAIGLTARDGSYRLTKFDFVNRRAGYWCEANLTTFAPTYDGNLWFVALNDEIYAIDTNAKDFEAVWRVPDMGGNVYEVARSKNKLMLLVDLPGKGIEKWWYDLPDLVLRSRNQGTHWYETKNERQSVWGISSFIAYSVVVKQEIMEPETRLEFVAEVYDYDTGIAKFDFPSDIVNIAKPQIMERQCVLIKYTKDAMFVTLYEIPDVRLAMFYLRQSKSGHVRLDEKYLTITDELGRIIVFDHKEKILRKNMCL